MAGTGRRRAMPEGHTLHRLAGELNAVFAGRPVRVGSPQGRFADAAALVDGTVAFGERKGRKVVDVVPVPAAD